MRRFKCAGVSVIVSSNVGRTSCRRDGQYDMRMHVGLIFLILRNIARHCDGFDLFVDGNGLIFLRLPVEIGQLRTFENPESDKEAAFRSLVEANFRMAFLTLSPEASINTHIRRPASGVTSLLCVKCLRRKKSRPARIVPLSVASGFREIPFEDFGDS